MKLTKRLSKPRADPLAAPAPSERTIHMTAAPIAFNASLEHYPARVTWPQVAVTCMTVYSPLHRCLGLGLFCLSVAASLSLAVA